MNGLTKRYRKLGIMAACLALVVAACGTSDSDGSATTEAPGSDGSTATTAPGSEGGGESTTVPAAAEGIDVVFAQSTQITFLDPAGKQPQNYPGGYEAAYGIFSGLIRFDSSLTLQPDLATEWSLSDDGLTWTFVLREGVTFHDGTPLNADAVVAHYAAMLDPEYNLSAFTLWEPISSVEKVDDYTVAVTTAEPYGALLNTIAHGSALIPSPAAVAEHGEDFGLHPVGTGPFKVRSFLPGSELVLEAFADYYGEAPPYASITYKYVGEGSGRVAALLSGDAQVIDAVPVQEAERVASEANLVEVAGLQTFGIGLNQTNPALTDKSVRQAFNYAIDKQGIVTSLFRGHATVLDAPLAPNTSGSSPSGSYPQDQEKAATMLADAGYVAGDDGVLEKDGERLSFRLRASDGLFPNDILVAQAIQDQLGAIGVEVEIEKVDPAEFFGSLKVAQADVTFDMVLFGFNPSHASGLIQLDIMFTSNPTADVPPGWNYNWYSNTEFDDLIAEARSTADPAAGDALLAEAQQILWDDAPYIWLYVRNILSANTAEVLPPTVLPVVFTVPSRVE
ncbi:MAG: ABC transporter substrate-binding protein [Actinomycetota bacterium]